MNELTTFYGQIAEQSEARDKARAVYALCRFITPQFYSKQTRDEAAATVSSIQVLTADIDGAVMAKMCEMAAKDYPKARSENPKVFFDINYILTFYKMAAESLRPAWAEVYLGDENGVNLWGDAEEWDWDEPYKGKIYRQNY